MSLVGKLWAMRWVRILTFTFSVFTVLTVGAWIEAAVALNKNSITIGSSDFNFPSSLTLTNVQVSQPDLQADIKNLYVDWNWGDLFSKEFVGDHIVIDGARINMKLIDSPDSTSQTSDPLVFAYKTIHITN